MNRILPGTQPKQALAQIRESKGYFITNTARDMSQSDFKNRILLHTDLLAASARERAGYLSLEITGGASVHVDVLRKQVDPFLKLDLLRREMPQTMFQTLCRGVNLFGYRPYPQNVVRLTVREFARYVDVWRVFDFLNYVPNMLSVFEEVQAAGKLLEPCICFSTGPEHTDQYYVSKVKEIREVTGADILLCIKNHGGLGTPKRIGQLVQAILDAYPDLIVHYHGHNTDGNDIARIVSAVEAGAKIVDASDHAFTGFYGPPPILSVMQTLQELGYQAQGVDEEAVIETSESLRAQREHYAQFESQFKGFLPTVQIHKLPGGAMGSSLEQAVKGKFLDRMPEILQHELPRVQKELGNFWSVTPGSQILWTTAVSNVLQGERYANPSGDLQNLLLGRYGPFPFYQPEDWIFEKVLGPDWQDKLEKERGPAQIEDVDLDAERKNLAQHIGREPTTEQLVTYLQHPADAVDFYKFEENFGRTYVLPPSVWLRQGGYRPGESIEFNDHFGKSHVVEVGPSHQTQKGEWLVYLNVNHHQQIMVLEEEQLPSAEAKKPDLGPEEITELAKSGDIRSPFAGVVCELMTQAGNKTRRGDRLLILEAMKMQTPIACEVSGTVAQVYVKLGQTVQTGDRLVKVVVEK